MLKRLKSFLRGMATVFDVWPAPRKNLPDLPRDRSFPPCLDWQKCGYLPSDPGYESDAEKIASDWQKVGDDLRLAMRKTGRSLSDEDRAKLEEILENQSKIVHAYVELQKEKNSS